MQIDLTSQKNRYRCHVFVDIDRIASEEHIEDLDINQHQRELSDAQVVEDFLKGSVTSLYHIFGVFRVNEHIPRTCARIISAGWGWRAVDADNEDNVKAKSIHIDIASYLPAKARAIITSVWKNGLSEHEQIGMHFLHGKQHRHILQYSYTDGDAAGLIRRIEKLEKHDRNFIVTNKRLRDVLNIT